MESASSEFDRLEESLDLFEEYIGIYEFSSYNILFLPPSFPYAGMENPIITFASPSLINGLKSLYWVANHEMAHSWTGNLVTNANWQSFWLNEGFTTFLERKITEIQLGNSTKNIIAYYRDIEMRNTIRKLGSENSLTSLNPNLTTLHPDDYFSLIPYEKGYQFLLNLEQVFGEKKFQQFLKIYIKKFRQ